MTHEEYKENVAKLIKWSKAYYEGNPIALDSEYDELYKKVETYEKENPNNTLKTSPTQMVDDGLVEGFLSKEHEERMYSLQDVFNYEEFKQWYKNVVSKLHENPELYLEKKFDGASLNLQYVNGKLTTALTRGDGIKGDEITAHAFYISGIPHQLNGVNEKNHFIEIRGEVVILNNDFEAIQEERAAKGEELFKNSRNAAAGVLHSLDPKDCQRRRLTFLPYSIGAVSPDWDIPKEQKQIADMFIQLGFNEGGDRVVVDSVEGVKDYFDDIMAKRDSLEMRIDGIVVKVNDLNAQTILGFNNKYPKWACAWKPPADEKTTKIIDVIKTVGKNGQITPVAIVEPTEFNDSTVQRVTLSNFDTVEDLDLHYGDTISIIKSGDIIPKITGVFKDRRQEGARKINVPQKCPTCCAPVEKKINKTGDESVAIFCTNPLCPSQIKGLISYMVSKPVLNISGIGEKTIDQMVDILNVDNIIDVFDLEYEDLMCLDGFKDRKAKKTIESIKSIIGNITYDKVLVMLNVDGVGKSISKLIVEELQDKCFDPNEVEKLNIHGVSNDVIQRLANVLRREELYIKSLIETLNPKPLEKKENRFQQNIDGKFSGLTICITGTLDHPRSYYAKIIEENGGIFTDKMKKGVDILVAGDKVGKTKLEKAEKLGIKVESADFLKIN